MFRIFVLFVTIFISLSFLGCGGSTPNPKSVSSSSMPSWYLSEVPTDSINFYGVGEGSTKDSAKAKALTQISGAISTTVESAMEITESDSTKNGYTQESKNNIKSSTDSIKFTGVTIIDTAYVDGKFYTYLKVDRATLFNSLKRDLDNNYHNTLNLFKQMRSRGSFEVLKKSDKLTKMVDKILSKPTIEILKSINHSFNSTQYRDKIISIKTDLDNIKANIVVYIEANTRLSSYYKDIVEKYISSYGLSIVNYNTNMKNLLVINVSVNARQKNVRTSDPRLRGATFVDATIVLTTKDYSGKIVAQNRVDVINISKDGLESAKIKTKKFEREIKRKGILNILLKASN